MEIKCCKHLFLWRGIPIFLSQPWSSSSWSYALDVPLEFLFWGSSEYLLASILAIEMGLTLCVTLLSKKKTSSKVHLQPLIIIHHPKPFHLHLNIQHTRGMVAISGSDGSWTCSFWAARSHAGITWINKIVVNRCSAPMVSPQNFT